MNLPVLSWVYSHVPHSMMKDGESTSLADDQIGPLDDDDRDEVRGLEGELQLLSIVERLQQKDLRF